jgi:hypothetical protein
MAFGQQQSVQQTKGDSIDEDDTDSVLGMISFNNIRIIIFHFSAQSPTKKTMKISVTLPSVHNSNMDIGNATNNLVCLCVCVIYKTTPIFQDGTQQQQQHSGAGVASSNGSGNSTYIRDIMDIKLEALLRQWHQSNDILFAIHPVDGSLLIWYVLCCCGSSFFVNTSLCRSLFGVDDTFRQPTLSFTSRLPNALPLTDALSLRHNVLTFNAHHPVFVHLLQKHHGGTLCVCVCI